MSPPIPRTADPEGQAMAFRGFGEQITEIGLREIAEDRSLTSDEVQAVAYCARNLLAWCEAEAAPDAGLREALPGNQHDLADALCFLDGHDRPESECHCDGCADFAESAVACLRSRAVALATPAAACEHMWTAATSYQIAPGIPGSVCGKCGAIPAFLEVTA